MLAGLAASIPVDNGAVEPAAQHVIDLLLHLQRVTGDVTYIHVIAKPEPGNKVRVDFGGGSGVEQAADRLFADIGAGNVAVGLREKAVGRAGIVRRFCCQRRGGFERRPR